MTVEFFIVIMIIVHCYMRSVASPIIDNEEAQRSD